MNWFYLLLAGVLEIAFTTTLRYVNGFKNLPATAAFFVCMVASLYMVGLATRSIPLGTAYAIWTAIGAAGTVVIGMAWFGEPVTAVRVLLIVGIVGCVVGLKLTSGTDLVTPSASPT